MTKTRNTRLIRHLCEIPSALKHGVITIGNFDGVHLGHQQLVKKVNSYGQATGKPSLVVTFEPHPFEYFAAQQLKIPRLTRLREKFTYLRQTGCDGVVLLPFNAKLAAMSAREFIVDFLYPALLPTHIIIGDDFHFGHQRQGDFKLLQQLGAELGFTVEALPTVTIQNERVSSTRVRAALANNDQALAQALLGRPYTMQGRVCHGDQLGRQLDCPTANIFLHRRLTPVHGIYTVLVHGLAERPLPGVANVGTRPTVNGTRTLLEVHLLDFNADIYNRYVEVEFLSKRRAEERYPNLELLKAQMALDVQDARNFFKQRGEL